MELYPAFYYYKHKDTKIGQAHKTHGTVPAYTSVTECKQSWTLNRTSDTSEITAPISFESCVRYPTVPTTEVKFNSTTRSPSISWLPLGQKRDIKQWRSEKIPHYKVADVDRREGDIGPGLMLPQREYRSVCGKPACENEA